MQNTNQGSDKKSYRVLLLLVVGLAAFTTSMKELNQVQDLTLQTTKLVAQWKEALAPSDEMTVRVETCQNSRTVSPAPPVMTALPPLPAPPVEPNASDVVTPEVAPAPPAPPAVPAAREVPKAKRAVRPAHNPDQIRVLLSTDEIVEKNIKDALESAQTLKALKAKNRRFMFVTPDGHDFTFRTFNRTINLRSAS